MTNEIFKELEFKIRDILDRNNFVNQKIDLSTMHTNKNVPIQDAFRIRVMSPPLRFSVEIVKPIPLKDFLFIAGRINISPDHLKSINNMNLNQRLDLFDEIKIELTRGRPNFKFIEANGAIIGIESMVPIIIPGNEEQLAKALFDGMDEVNKAFFLVIVLIQKFLRKAGFQTGPESGTTNLEEGKSFYQ